MHEADLVGVHEAGIAHHVAAVGQVNGQHGTAAVFHCRRSVMMQFLVVVRANVAAGKHVFQMFRKPVSMDIKSSKRPCLGHSFTIRILPSRSMMVALISPTFRSSALRREGGHRESAGGFRARISGTGSQWHAASRVAASTFRRT